MCSLVKKQATPPPVSLRISHKRDNMVIASIKMLSQRYSHSRDKRSISGRSRVCLRTRWDHITQIRHSLGLGVKGKEGLQGACEPEPSRQTA